MNVASWLYRSIALLSVIALVLALRYDDLRFVAIAAFMALGFVVAWIAEIVVGEPNEPPATLHEDEAEYSRERTV